ncbi:MAG: HAMP domain-containing sensor histidine kinase, partial [Endomicrobiia bacterium]|nr:HAMP domain-containing sensor histidine kinase [Endomicrobiia bacterium]
LSGLSCALSAGAAVVIGRAVLKESLLAAHFVSEREMLGSVAERLVEAAAANYPGAPIAGLRLDADGRPKFVLRSAAQKRPREISADLLALWREAKPYAKDKAVFATDGRGNLAAHDDEARVAAGSDFSGLEVVNIGARRREAARGALVTSDEKARKAVAVWADGPAGLVIFSMTPYEEVMQPLTEMTARAGAWVGIIAALFAAAGVFFARRITTPIERLRAAAVEVARGKLDAPSWDIGSTDEEVASLAADFGRMTESLKKLSVLRDDLVHMIVHDLKSPLSAIVSSIEFLNSVAQTTADEKQLKFLRLARNSSKNLMRLIDDLLDVAKLEGGKLSLRPTQIKVRELLESSMRDFEAMASNEKKLLTLHCPDGLSAECDESLIRRVVSNLIANAMKHTKNETGAVEVEAQASGDGNYWTLSVSDNGAGVPEEYRSKIFDKFVQVEGRRTQIRSGTGLGLTFSKMVAEAHGGEISVASEDGRGSSFVVKLPLKLPGKNNDDDIRRLPEMRA